MGCALCNLNPNGKLHGVEGIFVSVQSRLYLVVVSE